MKKEITIECEAFAIHNHSSHYNEVLRSLSGRFYRDTAVTNNFYCENGTDLFNKLGGNQDKELLEVTIFYIETVGNLRDYLSSVGCFITDDDFSKLKDSLDFY
jgi:hypothetical protein